MSETEDPPVTVGQDEIWHLRLYVAGQSPKSLRAYANLKDLCEQHLAGRYEIEIIDLVEQPALAQADDILAVPTLVRHLPAPLHKIIGDLSNTERVLVGLRLVIQRRVIEHPRDGIARRFSQCPKRRSRLLIGHRVDRLVQTLLDRHASKVVHRGQPHFGAPGGEYGVKSEDAGHALSPAVLRPLT